MKHIDEETVLTLDERAEIRESNTLPPGDDEERTSPNHHIPTMDESLAPFAEVVGKELDKRLSGIMEGINAILVFAQEVPAIKAELAAQRVEIEALKAWRREVERAAE